MSKTALSINCGSSSVKYAVFDVADEEKLVERRTIRSVEKHADAVFQLLSDLSARGVHPDVVGHRIVQGGADLTRPTRINDEVLRHLESLTPLAPLHLPSEIAAIRAVTERLPNTPQVACFDTAFHSAMPEVARRYPLPASLLGTRVRRYGFHGLSYEFIVSALGKELRPHTIVAHLGSGASMAAILNGKSVDTTMGFTPTGGLVMGTRPGDLDPALVLYLLGQGTTAPALDRILQHESGLRALSERTSDMSELLRIRDSDERASFAIDAFCSSARQWIGALAAVLGGVDALVFTGGIGENAWQVRAQIAKGLAHLGIEIDATANERNATGCISSGACDVRVIRTDEERMVARHAIALL
ncbi:MAG: acetate/propionate family kinase [Polyangiaceae bacterium]